MAEPASRPQPKKSKPRAADDDEESQGPTEGTGMIAKNNKLEQVDTEIKETQGVLLKTIEMTLARGEVINSLEDKSLRMAVNADQFKKKAGETKRHFCFQHYRNILIMVGIVAVVGVVLYLIFRPKSS